MTKDREERKKEKKLKKEKKEKKERKERKRLEAEELLKVKEKKISKKHKSKSKEPEKPEKSKKKSKKHEVVEDKSPKKSKEKKKKHKKVEESDESEEEPETQIVKSQPVTVPIATTSYKESDSDFESDKEDIKVLLETYTKEELINLIYRTAEKGSRLISAVLESADRDSSQRNIFVRGLAWDTTHENLKAAFEVHGEIEECSVVMDKDTGRAKGYGFVLFKTRKGAREALRYPEKRMYNRTVICNLAKPPNAAKAREPVESVKIDLTHNTANQSELALPGLDMAHGLDKGHQQPQNMAMYAGPNMPFYGQPPGFNPMYGAMMGNQAAAMMSNQMVAGLPPNYRSFAAGMMNQGPMVPSNHMALAGQYVGGDSNGHMGLAGQYVGDSNGNGAGPTPGFDGDRAWYLR